MALSEHFLLGKAFSEHHAYYYNDVIEKDFFSLHPTPILFKGKENCFCFAINEDWSVNNSYYIGVDWLTIDKAVYVQPKVNDEGKETNYLSMLFHALRYPEVFDYCEDLFEIKWDQPAIKINQQQDILTPLLIVQYLQVVKNIVRKGLKKSYYKVERNLNSRVKGKVLVGQTIKQNLLKNKILQTYCSYDEFGFNGIENRILKKALRFAQRYLHSHKSLNSERFYTDEFNYVMPAFELVSEEASLNDCINIKINPFYKEYKLAIALAKQILRRFGYNINSTINQEASTPPFWIDTSKLFEIYVLGLLKDKFKNIGIIDYHFTTRGNELDFIINAGKIKMVVDAKYKLKYQSDQKNNDDMRQVSGYARLKKVYEMLGKNESEIIDCLIIHPNGFLKKNEKETIDINKLTSTRIKDYVAFYKYGVRLPVI